MKQVIVILLILTSITSFASHRINDSRIPARIEASKPSSSQQQASSMTKTLNSATKAAVIMSKTNVIAKKTTTMIG